MNSWTRSERSTPLSSTSDEIRSLSSGKSPPRTSMLPVSSSTHERARSTPFRESESGRPATTSSAASASLAPGRLVPLSSAFRVVLVTTLTFSSGSSLASDSA